MGASGSFVVLPSRSGFVRRRERFDSGARKTYCGIAGWVIVARMRGRRIVVVWTREYSMLVWEEVVRRKYLARAKGLVEVLAMMVVANLSSAAAVVAVLAAVAAVVAEAQVSVDFVAGRQMTWR
jgi:hypothetical protein